MFIRKISLFFFAIVFCLLVSSAYGGDIISCDSFENCPDGSEPLTNALLALEAKIDALAVRTDALEAENIALKALLAGVTRGTDPNTRQDTLTFTNMNVQVVSGSGTTDGAITGAGNLIIGYNEKQIGGDDRSGSHMLVIGSQNNYSSYGGMVVGFRNSASGKYASVSGGEFNTASGWYASVSGGVGNTASFHSTSVSGGNGNTASNDYASVSGGANNTASGWVASISGGLDRTASGPYDWVAGELFQDQ